jgi:hypothetical protein
MRQGDNGFKNCNVQAARHSAGLPNQVRGASCDVKACGSGWGRPPSDSVMLTLFCCAVLQNMMIYSYMFAQPVLQLNQRCQAPLNQSRILC